MLMCRRPAEYERRINHSAYFNTRNVRAHVEEIAPHLITSNIERSNGIDYCYTKNLHDEVEIRDRHKHGWKERTRNKNQRKRERRVRRRQNVARHYASRIEK